MDWLKIKMAAISWVKQLLLIIAVTFMISTFIIQTYDINDLSMEPTFDRQGNRVLVFLTPYYFKARPDYGDIVVIDSRVERLRTTWDRVLGSPLVTLINRDYHNYMWVKRVVGLPGDILEFREKGVYLNGEALIEPYTAGQMEQPFEKVIVPEGYIFVMGDNRDRSRDSRVIGPVPLDNIQGRVVMRLFPLGKISFY